MKNINYKIFKNNVQREKKIHIKLLWSVGQHDAFYFPKYDGLSARKMLDFSK